ncbi:hypothetical protein ACGF8B_09400 [Streptomyces sp. NPDC047917]|uniref:effector-associated constant component EACC1 n=1 Tax=Streptomyces sp. NPDC047917 TaxID=3365491 RepID=UPI0037150835
MRLTVSVEGGDSGGLHHLRRWLSDEPELRGRIRGRTASPLPSDAMGLGAEALLAVVGPGGVAAVFAGALVAWVQSRRGDQTVTITRPDGATVTVSATRVRGMTAEQNARLARELIAFLGPAPDPVPVPPDDGEPSPEAPQQ